MSKNTIRVDGEKVKRALETVTSKTVYQISVENGFSDNFLKQACKANRASPIVQSVMRSYGLDPEDFKLEEEKEYKQMTLEDIQEERLQRSIEISKDVMDKISYACNKAFTKLAEEWEKAMNEYKEEIRKLQEGK